MWLLWMAYAAAVAGILGGGGVVAERLLRRAGMPGRWVWIGAMAASLALPVWTWHLAGGGPMETTEATALAMTPEVVSTDLGMPEILMHVREAVAELDRAVVRTLWPAASLLLASMFGFSLLRLRRARQSWPFSLIDGALVRVSPDVGPAVVGVFDPEIVLPRWVLGAERESRGWILRHEREHIRAGDPLIMTAGLALLVLLPWNLPLWWHLRRLRQAVELDCDARVLRGTDRLARHRYGTLLLDVGRRTRPAPFLAAFAEHAMFLERRIHHMSILHPVRSFLHLVLAGAVGGLVVAGAALLPGPDRPILPAAGEPEVSEAPEVAEISEPPAPPAAEADANPDNPHFTPYTRPPDLVNEEEVSRALAESFPPLLRDAGIGGTVDVYLFVDATGEVQTVRVNDSSGHEGLDAAALQVADVMRFRPALNRERRVPVWISLPVTFRLR